jgi:hypothetical protein
MRHLVILLVHLITTALKLVRLGGVRAVVAESVLAKHQLLILNRSRRRAPNLDILDRLTAGLCSLWIKPNRLHRVAIAFKPSTLLNFHRALVQRKISTAIFTETENQARSERSGGRFDSRRCRDETAQSNLGMSTYRGSDQSRVRNRY